MKVKIFVIFIIGIIAVGGVYFLNKKSDQTKTNPESIQKAVEPIVIKKTIVDEILSAKVGDTFGEMKVISVKSLINDGREVKFEGQFEVTGKYSFDDSLGQSWMISDIDSESQKKIPISKWFYLGDSEKLNQLFGQKENSGTATILIDNITVAFIPGTDAGGFFANVVKVVLIEK
ncbi:hypothetical protein HZC21_00100 [Candidatus Peregrinibacteria bacterium]|nr:hypothetical protein [Candidatus Peregrinibacteria bacterium]